jgi:MFS family permease
MVVNSVLALYVQNAFQASVDQVGLVISVAFAAGVVARVPVTLLMGRTAKYLTLVALATFVLAPIMYLVSSSLWTILIIRVWHGIGFGVIDPVVLCMLPSIHSVKKPGGATFAISAYASTLVMGSVAGPAVGSAVVLAYGLKGAFVLSSAFAGVALLSGVNLVRRSYLWRSLKSPSRGSLRRILLLRPAMGSFAVLILFGSVYGAILAYLPLYAVEKFAASAADVAGFFAFYFTIATVVRLSMHKLLSRIGKSTLLQIGFLNAIIGFFLLYVATNVQTLLVSLILLSIHHALMYPTSAIIVSEEVAGPDIVLGNSLLSNSADLGIAMGPIATGFLAASYGVTSSLMSASFAAILGLVIVRVMLSGFQHRSEEASLGQPVHVGK